MSVKVKFKSEMINSESSRKETSRTYYSFDYNELENFIQTNYPEGSDSAIGEIIRTRFYREGAIWYCDVHGVAELDSTGVVINFGNRRERQEPQRHTLRTVTLSLPLKFLDNYRTYWDHYLWAEVPSSIKSAPLPEDSYTSLRDGRTFYYDGILYAWTKTNHAPSQPADSGKHWVYVRSPAKGEERHITYHTYQITEYGEYNSESAASWAVKKALNVVVNKPPLGDMGVGNQGGQWKLDNASIRYNGKKWEAECVWTYLPAKWDPDLYPPRITASNIGY